MTSFGIFIVNYAVKVVIDIPLLAAGVFDLEVCINEQRF